MSEQSGNCCQCINPNAKRFEVKYKKYSPAMLEGFTDHCLTLEELGYPRKAGRFGVGRVLYGTKFTHEFSPSAEDRPTWDIGPKAA